MKVLEGLMCSLASHFNLSQRSHYFGGIFDLVFDQKQSESVEWTSSQCSNYFVILIDMKISVNVFQRAFSQVLFISIFSINVAILQNFRLNHYPENDISNNTKQEMLYILTIMVGEIIHS